jgi:hypothetical protein
MGLPAETRPKLARGIRLQFDTARDQWILQAPERVLVLDEIAADVDDLLAGLIEKRIIAT